MKFTEIKTYCQKFGGAFGGSKKKKKSPHKGFVGSKKERRLQKTINRNGGVLKLK